MITSLNTTQDQAGLDLLVEKLLELHSIVSVTSQDIVSYTDNELRALKAQVSLLDSNNVTVALGRIEAFLAANDADGNNVIDALPTLLNDLAALVAKVDALDTKVCDQAVVVETTSLKTTILEGKVNGIEGDVAAQKIRIEALEAKTDEVGLTEAQARAIAVEQDRELLSKLVLAIQGISFAPFDLGKTFPITNPFIV